MELLLLERQGLFTPRSCRPYPFPPDGPSDATATTKPYAKTGWNNAPVPARTTVDANSGDQPTSEAPRPSRQATGTRANQTDDKPSPSPIGADQKPERRGQLPSPRVEQCRKLRYCDPKAALEDQPLQAA